MPPTTAELLAVLRPWIAAQVPGLLPISLTVHFHGSTAPLTLPIGFESVAPPPFEPAVENERGFFDRCIADILGTLRAAGRPLTKTRLLEEMSKRNGKGECGEWSEATVCRRLAVLMEDGTLENPKGERPPGYRLVE